MNVFGIGIDVVETSRIESSISQFGEQFLSRIFTLDERAYCDKNKRAVLHYAARFAAKEAVSKALGTGIGKDVAFTEIEITKKESGEPSILLHGKAKEFAESLNGNISVTSQPNKGATFILTLPVTIFNSTKNPAVIRMIKPIIKDLLAAAPTYPSTISTEETGADKVSYIVPVKRGK